MSTERIGMTHVERLKIELLFNKTGQSIQLNIKS